MSVFMSMLPEMPKQIWIEMSCFAHIHGLISRLLKEWNKWHTWLQILCKCLCLYGNSLSGLFALTCSGFYYPLARVALTLVGISVALFQPYKSTAHNTIDSFLILCLVINYTFRVAQLITCGYQTLQIVLFVMIRLSVFVPFFYIVGLLGYWLVVKKG